MSNSVHPTDQDRATVLAKREAFVLGCKAAHPFDTVVDDVVWERRARETFPLTKPVPNEQPAPGGTWRFVDDVLQRRPNNPLSAPWVHLLAIRPGSELVAVIDVLTNPTRTVPDND